MKAVAVIALAGACSVPALDVTHKQCPCTTGYVCDDATNTCVSALGDAGPSSCLGSEPGALIFSDDFEAATLDASWVTSAGWAQTGGALVQSDANDQLAVAYTTATTTSSYRIVATMSGTAGGTGLGIAVRVSETSREQYDCLWEPGATGVLVLQSTNNGGAGSTITQQVGLPSGAATDSITMEMLANGGLQCCLDGVPGATAAISSPTPLYAGGQPGLVTDRMPATFTSVTAFAN
ncbi:MAG TPA: hypothetical protein VGF94_02985 [Kofleriaceae bacterium]